MESVADAAASRWLLMRIRGEADQRQRHTKASAAGCEGTVNMDGDGDMTQGPDRAGTGGGWLRCAGW